MVFAGSTTKPGRAASSSGHPVRGERRTSVAAGMDGAVEARALARPLQGALHLLFPGSGGVQLLPVFVGTDGRGVHTPCLTGRAGRSLRPLAHKQAAGQTVQLSGGFSQSWIRHENFQAGCKRASRENADPACGKVCRTGGQ